MSQEQVSLMRQFVSQEVQACKNANPEVLTVLGTPPIDWLHPNPEAIGAVYIAAMPDGEKQTILVCKPLPAYEPTAVKFWRGDWFSEREAVYFCPNAVIVMRPWEEEDESLMPTEEN